MSWLGRIDQRAGRFSRNALTPSAASGCLPVHQNARASRSSARARSISRCIPQRSHLVIATDTGAVSRAISVASARAVERSSGSGTTRLTRPNSRASRALSRRPVSRRSAARAIPTRRGSVQVLSASGTTPRRTKTKPIFALSPAIRMSHCRGSVAPTPTAGPLIAAMIGFRTSHGAIERGGLAQGRSAGGAGR